MVPPLLERGPLASALGVDTQVTSAAGTTGKNPKNIAVSSRAPMNQPWTEIVSGQHRSLQPVTTDSKPEREKPTTILHNNDFLLESVSQTSTNDPPLSKQFPAVAASRPTEPLTIPPPPPTPPGSGPAFGNILGEMEHNSFTRGNTYTKKFQPKVSVYSRVGNSTTSEAIGYRHEVSAVMSDHSGMTDSLGHSHGTVSTTATMPLLQYPIKSEALRHPDVVEPNGEIGNVKLPLGSAQNRGYTRRQQQQTAQFDSYKNFPRDTVNESSRKWNSSELSATDQASNKTQSENEMFRKNTVATRDDVVHYEIARRNSREGSSDFRFFTDENYISAPSSANWKNYNPTVKPKDIASMTNNKRNNQQPRKNQLDAQKRGHVNTDHNTDGALYAATTNNNGVYNVIGTSNTEVLLKDNKQFFSPGFSDSPEWRTQQPKHHYDESYQSIGPAATGSAAFKSSKVNYKPKHPPVEHQADWKQQQLNVTSTDNFSLSGGPSTVTKKPIDNILIVNESSGNLANDSLVHSMNSVSSSIMIDNVPTVSNEALQQFQHHQTEPSLSHYAAKGQDTIMQPVTYSLHQHHPHQQQKAFQPNRVPCHQGYPVPNATISSKEFQANSTGGAVFMCHSAEHSAMVNSSNHSVVIDNTLPLAPQQFNTTSSTASASPYPSYPAEDLHQSSLPPAKQSPTTTSDRSPAYVGCVTQVPSDGGTAYCRSQPPPTVLECYPSNNLESSKTSSMPASNFMFFVPSNEYRFQQAPQQSNLCQDSRYIYYASQQFVPGYYAMYERQKVDHATAAPTNKTLPAPSVVYEPNQGQQYNTPDNSASNIIVSSPVSYTGEQMRVISATSTQQSVRYDEPQKPQQLKQERHLQQQDQQQELQQDKHQDKHHEKHQEKHQDKHKEKHHEQKIQRQQKQQDKQKRRHQTEADRLAVDDSIAETSLPSNPNASTGSYSNDNAASRSQNDRTHKETNLSPVKSGNALQKTLSSSVKEAKRDFTANSDSRSQERKKTVGNRNVNGSQDTLGTSYKKRSEQLAASVKETSTAPQRKSKRANTHWKQTQNKSTPNGVYKEEQLQPGLFVETKKPHVASSKLSTPPPPPPASNTIASTTERRVCRYFLLNRCSFKSCSFLHPEEEVTSKEQSSYQYKTSKNQQEFKDSKSNDSESVLSKKPGTTGSEKENAVARDLIVFDQTRHRNSTEENNCKKLNTLYEQKFEESKNSGWALKEKRSRGNVVAQGTGNPLSRGRDRNGGDGRLQNSQRRRFQKQKRQESTWNYVQEMKAPQSSKKGSQKHHQQNQSGPESVAVTEDSQGASKNSGESQSEVVAEQAAKNENVEVKSIAEEISTSKNPAKNESEPRSSATNEFAMAPSGFEKPRGNYRRQYKSKAGKGAGQQQQIWQRKPTVEQEVSQKSVIYVSVRQEKGDKSVDGETVCKGDVEVAEKEAQSHKKGQGSSPSTKKSNNRVVAEDREAQARHFRSSIHKTLFNKDNLAVLNNNVSLGGNKQEASSSEVKVVENVVASAAVFDSSKCATPAKNESTVNNDFIVLNENDIKPNISKQSYKRGGHHFRKSAKRNYTRKNVN